ncbi:MAG: hypothetical protein M3165_10640 [Actinomycetota bacterium]|nr:hypothetical protein [Actinomycetota bacterium]
MISSMTMPSRPTPAPTRLRLPVGTCAPAAMICADAEVYIKGTTVFADRATSAVARPNALGTPGARRWSPPV